MTLRMYISFHVHGKALRLFYKTNIGLPIGLLASLSLLAITSVRQTKLSFHLFTCLYLYTCPCLSVYLFMCLSVLIVCSCLPICLSA